MKKEESKGVDYINLHSVTHQKINYISSKAHISQTDVYYTAKEFFAQLLQLDYEFTHEELLEEFEKTYLDKDTHEKLIDFIKTIGQMEYSTKKFSQNELKTLVEEMRDIINNLLSHHKRNHSLIDSVRNFLFPSKYQVKDVTAFEALQKKVNEEDEIITEELEAQDAASFAKIIEAIYNAENVKIGKANYKKAMAFYNTLDEEEQSKLYDDLMEAYKYIQNKIGL
jgi:hypothetical protein